MAVDLKKSNYCSRKILYLFLIFVVALCALGFFVLFDNSIDPFWGIIDRRPFLWKPAKSEPGREQIPKIIHQVFLTFPENRRKNITSLPEEWADTPRLYQEALSDWTYYLWKDDMIREFLEEHHSWFLPYFDSYKFPIQKVDAVRYFLLYTYGGFYVDFDMVPNRKDLSEVFEGHSVLIAETPDWGLTNAFMATVPHHPFWLYVQQLLPIKQTHWYDFILIAHFQVLFTTGPVLIWQAFNSYPGRDDITIVPPRLTGKNSVCNPIGTTAEQWFRHLHGSSWHRADSTLFLGLFWCNGGKILSVLIFLCFLWYGWRRYRKKKKFRYTPLAQRETSV